MQADKEMCVGSLWMFCSDCCFLSEIGCKEEVLEISAEGTHCRYTVMGRKNVGSMALGRGWFGAGTRDKREVSLSRQSCNKKAGC